MSRRFLKPIDAWSEVLITDPLTNKIALQISRIKGIHPLHVTVVGLFLKLLASGFYFTYADPTIIIVPVIFFLGILVDGMDGKVARLTGKDIVLHGSADFICDQIVNSIFFLSMLIAFQSSSEYLIWMYIWFVIFFINMSLQSTKYRLHSSLGKVNPDSVDEMKKRYDAALPPFLKNRIVKKAYNAYLNLYERTSKHRLDAKPSEVDSELVFFVIFPLLFALGYTNLSYYVLIASVILLIPALIYAIILCFVLTKKLGSNKQSDS